MKRIATTIQRSGKHFGLILFENGTGPVIYFRSFKEEYMLIVSMIECFKPDLHLVSKEQFNEEIDYIESHGSRYSTSFTN